jgi:hypothetical protein
MAKLYTKATWVDEVLAGAARMDINEDDGTPIHENVEIALHTGVTVAGSDVDAAKMNNIEDGLDAVDTLLSQVNNVNCVINGKIVPSVASNNLTLALKTFAGTDPSTADPVIVCINGVIHTISAALSVTVNAGTNWFNSGGVELATHEVDYFAYLGYNATDGVVIGFSRIPSGCQYGDFSATNTNEKYAVISTITNAAATDAYIVISRFAATLSAGAGYTWTVPTFTPANLIQRPIYHTRVLEWTPVFDGFSADPTDLIHEYSIGDDGWIFYAVRQKTSGTSNTTTRWTLTLPFTALTKTNMIWQNFCQVIESGTSQTGYTQVDSGENLLKVYTTSSVYTSGDGRRCAVSTGRYHGNL